MYGLIIGEGLSLYSKKTPKAVKVKVKVKKMTRKMMKKIYHQIVIALNR